MYFKPRIFISSTLEKNLSIREDIEKHFRACGAEPLLYETDLTPSANKYTYRSDILESDFVIFIIKDEYGKKTDSGLSGTHEELKIAFEGNIPNHVYIKHDDDTSSEKTPSAKLKELIDENHISYYYFKNDKELLKRIKETTFTIAKEATLENITKKSLDKKTSLIVAMNYDYEQALGIIKIIEAILDQSNRFDINETSLFMTLESLFDWINNNVRIFIDKKLQNKIESLSNIWVNYADKHGNDYCINKQIGSIQIPVWGKIDIYSYERVAYSSGVQYMEYINKFVDEFKDFCDYIKAEKFDVDKFNF